MTGQTTSSSRGRGGGAGRGGRGMLPTLIWCVKFKLNFQCSLFKRACSLGRPAGFN